MRTLLAASLLVLVACSGSQGSAPSGPSEPPAPSASTDPPPEAAPPPPSAAVPAPGWDAAKLDELAAYAESKSTKALLLVEGDQPILERYFAGADATFTRDVASVQKSVTAILAGIAIDKGLLSLDDTVTSILGPGWSNAPAVPEAQIKMRHLLTMTSGLDLGLGYAAPAGSAWLYNDDAFYRVRLALEKKTGEDMNTLAHAWLFDRIGMADSAFQPRLAAKDSKGLRVVGLHTSARDLASFGRLVRERGTWSGETIVPASYVDTATSTSQALNESYGFLFWLNGKSGGLLPPSTPFTGPLVPSAPADAFAALGAGDQKVYVARSLDVVLVRLGDSAGETRNALSSFDEQLWEHVMAARVPPQ
jgi:CubicO group peptidase (beta-lactamase class C family)